MICPKCDTQMESIGYGDEQYPECGHVEWSEPYEEFHKLIYGTDYPVDDKEKDNM